MQHPRPRRRHPQRPLLSPVRAGPFRDLERVPGLDVHDGRGGVGGCAGARGGGRVHGVDAVWGSHGGEFA